MRRLKGVKANRRAGGMAFTLIPREHVAEILTSEPRPPAAPVATGLWAAACEVEHSIMGVTVDHVAIPARELLGCRGRPVAPPRPGAATRRRFPRGDSRPRASHARWRRSRHVQSGA